MLSENVVLASKSPKMQLQLLVNFCPVNAAGWKNCADHEYEFGFTLIFRSTSKSRPNNIRGKNVRTSVQKKFLRFE